MAVGVEWLIEADGCDRQRLGDESALRQIFDAVIAGLDLRVLHSFWHRFPHPGGITGFAALTESHLACHTYPEYGVATFNLYCCRERPPWDWADELTKVLGARNVRINRIERGSRMTADTPTAGGSE